MKTILRLFICLGSFSCHSPLNKFSAEIEIFNFGELNFKLDSLSTGRSRYSEVILTDSINYFAFLNTKNNSIYLYSIQDEELSRVITNRIDENFGKISAFHYYNKDSLLLYNYQRGDLYWSPLNFDFSSKIEVPFMDLEVKPYITSRQRIFLNGNDIVLNSWGSQKEYYKNASFSSNSYAFIDFKTNEYRVDISYPNIYTEGAWGVQFYEFFHDYLPKEELMVFAYPIDPAVYIFDFKDRSITRNTVDGDVGLNVEPLSRKPGKVQVELVEEFKKQKSQNSYYDIKYWDQKDVFIRVVDLALPEQILESNDPFKLSFGRKKIQFISRDFKLLNEFVPEGTYFYPSLFFIGDKMYLEKIQFENEDALIFDIYTIDFMSKQ